MKDVSLAVKFLVEVLAVAALAFWGASLDGVLVSVFVGIAAPALAVVLWGWFAAPRSRHRLPTHTRVPFELSVFALAAALFALDLTAIAIAFATVVVVNAVLLGWLDQWEQ